VFHWVGNLALDNLFNGHWDLDRHRHGHSSGDLDDLLNQLLNWIRSIAVDNLFHWDWNVDISDLLHLVRNVPLDNLFHWHWNFHSVWNRNIVVLGEGAINDFLDLVGNSPLNDLLYCIRNRSLDDSLDGVWNPDFLWNGDFIRSVHSAFDYPINWEGNLCDDFSLNRHRLRAMEDFGHGIGHGNLLSDYLLWGNDNFLAIHSWCDDSLWRNNNLLADSDCWGGCDYC
jgi:hypothetical protein